MILTMTHAIHAKTDVVNHHAPHHYSHAETCDFSQDTFKLKLKILTMTLYRQAKTDYFELDTFQPC